MHLAIGGCLKAPPIEFGLTADTGGHIAYIIGAATAQADAGADVCIVTRAVEAAFLSEVYGRSSEQFGRVRIARLQTPNRQYLEKERLDAELLDLTFAFVSELHRSPRRPDLVHAHFADAAEIAFVARDAFGIPVVYTPHALGRPPGLVGSPGIALPSRVNRERRALEEADAVVVSSADEATIQVGECDTRVPGAKLHRIPPGVPEHGSSGAGPARGVVRLDRFLAEPDKPIVLAIARPVRKKNLSGLVRAFLGSGELRWKANLVILAGRSHDAFRGEQASVLAELHEMVARAGLRGSVAMPTEHAAADVAMLYGRAARGGVFVNVAHHEPFGLTLLEAASHGVPVVATRAGGARDIVGDLGHGILVDPSDEVAIAEACLAILNDRALHAVYSANGRLNLGRYDWGHYARETLALYEGLADGRLAGSAVPHLRIGATGEADAGDRA